MAQRLSSVERMRIEALRATNVKVKAIAKRLKRHPSTIYREPKRGSGSGGYDAVATDFGVLGSDLLTAGHFGDSNT